jgi:hypothetical protein
MPTVGVRELKNRLSFYLKAGNEWGKDRGDPPG